MELARFEFYNHTYIYYLNNELLEYKKIKNNNQVPLNETDKKIMDYVLKFITISKEKTNHLFITKLNSYDVFLDKISGLKFLKKSNKIVVDKAIFPLLSSLNSNHIDYFRPYTVESRDKIYRKIFLVNQFIIVTLYTLFMSMVINESSRLERNDKLEETFKDNPYSYSSSITVNNYEEILRNNPNLSEEEREVLIRIASPIIEEQSNFINNDWIKYTNGQLRIIDYNKKSFLEPNTRGSWHSVDSAIKMFIERKITDSDEQISEYEDVLLHEALHSFCISCNSKEGHRLCEGMTELMKHEYNKGTYKHTYNDQIIISKILMEIVGREKMLKYYFAGDIKGLEEELSTIYGTIDDAKKFMALIDMQTDLCKNNSFNQIKEINEKIVDMLSKYYEGKYHKPMEKDILIQYYLRQGNFRNYYFGNIITINETTKLKINTMDKFYFSKDLRRRSYYDDGATEIEILKSFDNNGSIEWKEEYHGAMRITITELCNQKYLEDKELAAYFREAKSGNLTISDYGTPILLDMYDFLYNKEIYTPRTILSSALYDLLGAKKYIEIYQNGNLKSLKNELINIIPKEQDATLIIGEYDYFHYTLSAREQKDRTLVILELLRPYFDIRNIDVDNYIANVNTFDYQIPSKTK